MCFNRDSLIEHLQQEIAHLRKEIQRLIHEHQRIVDQLNEKIGELQVDLATKVMTDCKLCCYMLLWQMFSNEISSFMFAFIVDYVW